MNEITLLRRAEELILMLSKNDFLESLGFTVVDNDTFETTLLGVKIRGKIIRKIEENSVSLLLHTKFGSCKIDVGVIPLDDYSSRIKVNLSSWGLAGKVIKNKVLSNLINFVIKAEFEPTSRIQKKLKLKLYTNYKGLLKLLDTLPKDESVYYFLVINKSYIVEIVNGIPLYGDEIKKNCEDVCYIELYEFKPTTI
ncbi:hypothetical protein [Stygiolobus caldivivus]|uniref:Uncharacterized protein n=1 Tax=Stygiolobus caldivivus TaxID=2824673 RepID=A0A8D5U918_9CREN|nr:hypothetical protein [Stygiolobus caldivivus]BCU70971.1 hypothetical protein KN1_22680 [Stygiolobus caldivivus]